ncbi:sulfatase-like hydrolase/transferase [Planctomycetaceae bacterium SH139]
MSRLRLIRLLFFASFACFVFLASAANVGLAADRSPNIVWISSEDHGPEMGCYGDPQATTPNVDELAARGLRYAKCWSSAPVCAPARTTLITGMYPASLGAEDMRSMVKMPKGTRMFPCFLRDEGYYCTNASKEDYNVHKTGKVWDESSGKAHWRNRKDAQPFFAVFNSTVSHESAIRKHSGPTTHDPAAMRVPAYHPDTPTVRRDWAIYYDSVTRADAAAGARLRELEEAGLVDSTIVFYWGDHGSGMPRSKRWPCNSGLHVPLIVYIPEQFAELRPADYQAGGVSERLVSFVDFAPTVLSLAGIKPPAWMQGHAFLGAHISPPQEFIHGFRGRMDERLDLVRSVTDGRYVYLRNYHPERSQGQHVSYQFETPTTAEWRKLYDAGVLNAAQSIFWKTPKENEELYDLQQDRDEVRNLANSAAHQAILERLRLAQQDHAEQILDLGLIPEGQRFALAGDQPFYDWARTPGAYDFQRVFQAAEQASRPVSDVSGNSEAGLNDQNRVVRYWAHVGLLIGGEQAVQAQQDRLIAALEDEVPEIRVTAARALAMHGTPELVRKAVRQLVQDADWGQQSVWAAMLALDALGEIPAAELAGFQQEISALSNQGPMPDSRYSSYVPRLLKDLRGER